MTDRKKKNIAIAAVLFLLILPLYFLSTMMERDLAEIERKKNTQRRPAVQEPSVMNSKE